MADRAGTAPTEVTICGQTYHLRGEGADNLAELAELVDRKMREVAESTRTADTLKLAIMAALNIADDYVQARRGIDVAGTAETESRLNRMVTLLDDALAGRGSPR